MKVKVPFLVEEIRVRPSPEKPVRKMKGRMVVTLEVEDYYENIRLVSLIEKENRIKKIMQKDLAPLELVDFVWYELNRFVFDV